MIGDPSEQITAVKKVRDSNLELFRIIVMLLIVAHHYVVNSGLFEVLRDAETSMSSISMLLFGAWGKTGINCFVLITGYFMCRSNISAKKLIKLYLQITFYAILFYVVFCSTGYYNFSPIQFIRIFFPIWSISDGFVDCFLIFYLLIPFLNIFIRAIDKKQHRLLVILLISVYTLLPTARIQISFNYVTWFVVLYLIASYICIYNAGEQISHKRWGMITLSLVLVASASIVMMYFLYKKGYWDYRPYFFVSDSNKILALAVSLSSFMWFKSMRVSRSAIINAVGASTFGVLLIHANSDVMRQWLWKETVDCVGHFSDISVASTLIYAAATVLIVFAICSLIDYCRRSIIEPYLLNPILSAYYRTPIYRHFTTAD